jgi:hypothetical protein
MSKDDLVTVKTESGLCERHEARRVMVEYNGHKIYFKDGRVFEAFASETFNQKAGFIPAEEILSEYETLVNKAQAVSDFLNGAFREDTR